MELESYLFVIRLAEEAVPRGDYNACVPARSPILSPELTW